MAMLKGMFWDTKMRYDHYTDHKHCRTKYFNTTIPGAGIFLPVHRAERRSPSGATDSYPGTPSTPSHSTLNGRRTRNGFTPPTPALPAKFSQSVGPGARPASPHGMFKPRRPSLPRPESPLRRQPNLPPNSGQKGFSQSVRGPTQPLGTTPNKPSFKASTSGRATPGMTPRPYSRTGSRMGSRADEDGARRVMSGSATPGFSQTMRSPSRLGNTQGQEAELSNLRALLADRDRRLEEQASHLAEMESSVKELSALIPTDGPAPGSRGSEDDDKTTAQLRQALREKNEKISLLTVEFDAHRADFRSTLDSLEMASTETERVYEEQKSDLLAQIAELQEMRQNQEDFEGVAEQLKQLEELVAELEEGLEESRRGEAEARGEVEFLRGEVERGRSELRREREKAAAALKDAGGSATSPKELEAKDDEIRGLKAIIHRLSDGQNTPSTNGSSGEPEDVKLLQAALEESRLEREELEREVEQLRRDNAAAKTNGQTHARHASELTEKALPTRPRRDTVKAPAPLEEQTVSEEDTLHDDDASEAIFCELCKSPEHDTLDCTSLRAPASDVHARDDREHEPAAMPKPLSLGKENEDAASKPKANADKDEEKWCALCEKDGHLAFDCPEEAY